MILLSAQGMDVPAIAKVAFTSEDRVRHIGIRHPICHIFDVEDHQLTPAALPMSLQSYRHS